MKCPFATWLPVVNHGGTMGAHLGLCLHVQVGNGSLAGYFNNPSVEASSTFWAAKDGRLEQYVDTDIVAWAQGQGNGSYNSIETEGYPNEPLTPAQLSTIANVLKWLSEQYHFPIVGPVAHGTPGFTQHCNLDGSPDPAWSNHTCPDPLRMSQMPAIIQLTKPPITTGENVTSLLIGGQLHVWGVIGNSAYHWWQEVGPPASSWHVEPMPV